MQKQAERKEPINASSTTRNGLESGEREIIVVTRCSTITQWGKLAIFGHKRKNTMPKQGSNSKHRASEMDT